MNLDYSDSVVCCEGYNPAKSKPVVDKLLAKHYEFTEEELGYINYDIKCRIGDELNAE